MSALIQDLRYAARQLLKSPGFAALAVLTLALGIGANTAMFTVVESVLLRPLPYPHSERMISIGPPGDGFTSTSWLNYTDIRDQSQTLSTVAGYSEDVGVVQGRDGSLSVVTPGVTPNVFSMLGAKPLLGRSFSAEEGQTGGPQTAVLSEGLWRQVFSADPNIIGKTVRVNAKPRTVVGVMPSTFRFPESMGPDMGKGLWLPLQPTQEMLTERGYHFFYVVGEMKPGATSAQVQSELGAIAQRARQIDPKGARDLEFRAASYQEILTGPVRPVFIALVIALALVLLIACANVTNLLVARCLGRSQEFAVRAALGAGKFRLVRQLIVEGGLISLLGSGVGFGLAAMAVALIHKLPPGTIPRGDEIAVRWTVVLVLAVIATVTTLLSSILPALFVSRTDPQPALQAASRGVGGRSVRGRVSGWLVAGEVALSALLLISTGLLFRTLWNLEHARLGFDVTNLTYFTAMPADATGFVNMSVSPDTQNAPPSVSTLVYQPLLERMRHSPGVQDAALVTAPPFSGIDMRTSFEVVGRAKAPGRNPQARTTAVSGDYVRLMGTPVIRGRMISEDDTASTPYVAAVNEALARKYFAGEDPIGRQINLGGKDTGMVKPYTIVGVIGDQVDHSASRPADPLLMLPYQQVPTTSLFYPALLKTVVYFVVKTHANIAVAPAMHAVFSQVAPDYALDNFQSLEQARDQNNFSSRLGLYLIGAFAGMAVLMVVAGLYGVLAQLVSYRRREIGVRLALGATRQNILTMIMRQGTVMVSAGIAAGIVLAISTGRLVKSFLYGVKSTDAWTYAVVVLVLLLVGSIAALVPARRAAAVEPIQALRDE
ncbi:MAG TPA: ABC transporter permease [Candidatus Limnocylindrales bacterium]|nr:ABC transporter permease [Candidatus Limnocylindrales bacterium]